MPTEYTPRGRAGNQRDAAETMAAFETLVSMKTSRAPLAVAALLCTALLLPACATAAPASGGADAPASDTVPRLDAVPAGLPHGEVIAQGTVMDHDGSVELCLGAVMESYPPQCAGIPLVGWSWDGVDGADSSDDTTWGAYAVQGTYDGTAFTLTQAPILLALYDPAMPEDPTNGEPGHAEDATLVELQDDIQAELGADALSTWPQNGRLWVQVVWDDGTMQDAADARYGDDVVVIWSALREVG